MKFTKFLSFAALPLLILAVSPASRAAIEPALVQTLASTVLSCVVQPYGINIRTGNKVLGALRSHCENVVIQGDSIRIQLESNSYVVRIQDSEESDGGDLNDLFLTGGMQAQESLLASNVLAFGDPALSVLLAGGHAAEEVPQILDTSLNRKL
jgi:hypothetical protein